jgi:hypothetical protein
MDGWDSTAAAPAAAVGGERVPHAVFHTTPSLSLLAAAPCVPPPQIQFKRRQEEDGSWQRVKARLMLVDLAGSERAALAQAGSATQKQVRCRRCWCVFLAAGLRASVWVARPAISKQLAVLEQGMPLSVVLLSRGVQPSHGLPLGPPAPALAASLARLPRAQPR